jgi:hypothetical protein
VIPASIAPALALLPILVLVAALAWMARLKPVAALPAD